MSSHHSNCKRPAEVNPDSEPKCQKQKVDNADTEISSSSKTVSFSSLYLDIVSSILPFCTQEELHQVVQVSKIFAIALRRAPIRNFHIHYSAIRGDESDSVNLQGALGSRASILDFDLPYDDEMTELVIKLHEKLGVLSHVIEVSLVSSLTQPVVEALTKLTPNLINLRLLGPNSDDYPFPFLEETSEIKMPDLSGFLHLSHLEINNLYESSVIYEQPVELYQQIFSTANKCPITSLNLSFVQLENHAAYANFLSALSHLQKLSLFEMFTRDEEDHDFEYARIDFIVNSPAANTLTHLVIPSVMFRSTKDVKKLTAIKNLTHLTIMSPFGTTYLIDDQTQETRLWNRICSQFADEQIKLPSVKELKLVDANSLGFVYPNSLTFEAATYR